MTLCLQTISIIAGQMYIVSGVKRKTPGISMEIQTQLAEKCQFYAVFIGDQLIPMILCACDPSIKDFCKF